MKHVFCSAIIVFLLFVDILLAITFGWVRQAFGGVSMEELIFHLKVPLQGTDISSFVSFFRGALLPSIGIFALMMAVWEGCAVKKAGDKPSYQMEAHCCRHLGRGMYGHGTLFFHGKVFL